MLETRLFNVVAMGMAFMLIYTSFQTSQSYQATVLKDLGFSENLGFYGLSVINCSFAVSNFFATLIVLRMGPRVAMVFGATFIAIFIASFIRVIEPVFYVTSALIGFGASVLWTAQGTLISSCSDEATRGRNVGLFWTLYQFSVLIGSIIAYFIVPDDNNISTSTARTLYAALLGVCVAGIAVLFVLRPVPILWHEMVSENGHQPVLESIADTFRMLTRREIIGMATIMIYTGLAPSFFAAKYPGMVGGNDSDCQDLPHTFNPRFISFSMMCVGTSEIIGGLSLGYVSDRLGRIPVLAFGAVLHLCAYAGVYVNMVRRPFEPQPSLALVCFFLLGLGDSAFQTQVYATLGSVFPSESGPAFALFMFFQTIASAAAFFYSGHLAIVGQLAILVVFVVLGASTHAMVERHRLLDVQSGSYKPLLDSAEIDAFEPINSTIDDDAELKGENGAVHTT